jgi:hypothetical protein
MLFYNQSYSPLRDCEVTRLSIKTERKVLYPLRSSSKFFYELPVNVIPFFRSSSIEIPLDTHSTSDRYIRYSKKHSIPISLTKIFTNSSHKSLRTKIHVRSSELLETKSTSPVQISDLTFYTFCFFIFQLKKNHYRKPISQMTLVSSYLNESLKS